MIRTIAGVIILIGVVLWFPVWIQVVFFAAAVILLPYKFLILIPAIIGDALYAPSTQLSLTSHWMTLIVLAMLGIHWYVMKKMRVQRVYGLEA
ncbi:MAG TPA: hypothetical protein VL576_00070 [Candidatus Paceibacterota bacterium]|jgi:hypothetical protein|nr:hypothetical protein [Candidatus Paceibacterota bacterium]